MPTLTLDATIQTARIPEFPLYSSYGPLTTSDYTLLWLAAFDKTVKVDLNSLYTFFGAGSGGVGGSFPLAVLGDKMPYVISAAEAGGDTVNITSLAGKTFYLERGGQPLLTSEFQILNGGGFKLTTAGDKLVEGERFLLTIYELQGGSSSGGGSSSSSVASLIKGQLTVTTNTTFDVANHVNKLISLRGGSTQLQFTLPLLADLSDNTIIPIEAMINNTVEHSIKTQSGEAIYINNVSKSTVYMRAGEVLWLVKLSDGYYVINGEFAKTYRELVSEPKGKYKVGLNELVCDGSLYNRADYPRAWEEIQTLGSSLVSDTLWNTASATTTSGQTVENPYKGCFSTGDGSTTFRVPDLRNSALRGLKTTSGTDDERYYNKAGGFQKNQNAAHTHGFDLAVNGSSPGALVYGRGGDSGSDGTTGSSGGNEARMDNIGVLWVIKV